MPAGCCLPGAGEGLGSLPAVRGLQALSCSGSSSRDWPLSRPLRWLGFEGGCSPANMLMTAPPKLCSARVACPGLCAHSSHLAPGMRGLAEM